MIRRQGFSLLELLLVLVCIAAIVSWSIHHYQQQQRRAQTAQVLSDVKTSQRALDTYFHTQGCDQNGIFVNASSQVPVSCEKLQQMDSNVVCSRSPLVDQYIATIIKTDQTTAGAPPNKPIYRLVLQAAMNLELTPNQITWYQQELAAESSLGSNLTWNSLPTNSYVQVGDNAWILNGAGAFFRATENQRPPGNLPTYSGSFCAD